MNTPHGLGQAPQPSAPTPTWVWVSVGAVVLAEIGAAIWFFNQPKSNPATPRSSYWDIYELKITPVNKNTSITDAMGIPIRVRHGDWIIRSLLAVPNEYDPQKPRTITSKLERIEHSKNTAMYEAGKLATAYANFNIRNPNPARVTDEKGKCIFSVVGDPSTNRAVETTC